MNSQFDKSKIVRQMGENVHPSDWRVIERTPDYIRYSATIMVDGDPATIMKTEFIGDELVQTVNTHEFNDSDGKRWGDGKKVARIPMNVLFDPRHQLVEKFKEGDRDHLKWWLNHDDNRAWRTFKGRI